MRRALGITLGIIFFLGLYVGVAVLIDNWDGYLPDLAKGVLLGVCLAAALPLAVRHNVWGIGTFTRRSEQRRRERRER
jgi:hypothetical protein